MARRVALARAIVMDPEVLVYDEPFAGLDPISMGVILRLIQALNQTLGITSIVVSHDVHELAAIAHRSYLLDGGHVVAGGTTAEAQRQRGSGRQTVHAGQQRGAVSFHYPTGLPEVHARWRRRGGASMIGALRKIGAVSVFLVRLLAACVPALRRPGLIVRQVYNSGARSLIIIMLCGVVVGMIMGLAFSDMLQRFGSESALGVAAGLALLKELGPVLTALLFAGRAGTSLASEIGLMRATDQLTALEVMAVDPLPQCRGAALPGRHHRDAAAGNDLQHPGHLRHAAHRRVGDGRGCGHSGRRCRTRWTCDVGEASSRAWSSAWPAR
jgi:hypothetical protein